MNYIAFGVTIVLLVVLYFSLRKFINKNVKLTMKILSSLLGVVFFVRYFASERSLLDGVVALSYQNPFSSSYICFSTAILVWLSFASMIILCMLPFFKYSVLKNYAKTFCLVLSLFNIGFLSQEVYSFTGSYDISFCGVFLSIEIALTFLYSLYIFVDDILQNKKFKISKKEIVEMLCFLPLVLVLTVPPYLPQLLFGNFGHSQVIDFGLYHRIYLYLTFIFLIGLYFVLKRKMKDREYIRMILLFIALAGLISYCYDYDFGRFVEPTNWPLHLCNTAMFITPICLMFRLEKVFYFTLFINVLGAFLAMLMPNYADAGGFFTTNIVRFWINHSLAFSMPVLIILLGIYDRPKLRHFKYSMIGFAIYFVLVVFINAWFTNYNLTVDYFFVNSDFIADKLGLWAENLRNNFVWTIPIGGLKFVFYPLYQFLFFLVYVILGLAVWFLYVFVFQIQDFYLMLEEKNRKIKLDAQALSIKYGVKEVEKAMNKESKDKLVLQNVSKVYGNSTVYSAHDVDLTVEAGEIFGFLGPNGAGKSTIIKCIVGIQPPTKGKIEINGYDIEKQPLSAKMQFGFVPDHYALYENLTAREFINYIADLYGVGKKEREERISKYIKLLALEEAFDNKIKTFSHGMKQKVAIISALVHNPKVWILDEPLTGLDPTSIYQVKECMKEHAQNGNIVFFSSHIIDIVEKLCDRIAIIKNGQIVASAKLDQLQSKDIGLEQYYLDIIENKALGGEKIIVQENKVQKEKAESKFFEKKEKKKNKLDKKKDKKAKSKEKGEE